MIFYHESWGTGVHMNDWLATVTEEQLCGACGKHNYIQSDDDFTDADGVRYNYHPRNYPNIPFPYVQQDFYNGYVDSNDPPEYNFLFTI